jgi:hypothetical protein
MHRAARGRLALVLVGAGLPQLRGRRGRAKSYADRLFYFPGYSGMPVEWDGNAYPKSSQLSKQ